MMMRRLETTPEFARSRMRQALTLCASIALLLTAAAPAAQPSHKEHREAELSKKEESKVPERDLAGDISRRKKEKVKERPALEYDQYRLGVELQVASKRREQIDTLQKIIALGPNPGEAPDLAFRLAELYWEESKSYFFEANRKDDDIIRAKVDKNDAKLSQAEAEKAEALRKRDNFQALAIDQYRTIIARYKKYQRMDEVLFFLGHNMWDGGKEKEAVTVYQKLLKDYPKSRYTPDAWVAVGQYYFDSSKAKKELLNNALEAFKSAATFTDNKVYGYALYMQGWCYYNLGDFTKAQEMYKSVIYFGELQGKADNRALSLAKEARKDYVVAYSHTGDVMSAKADFQKVGGEDGWWGMMKGLAGLYFDDGKDKEATIVYKLLINERPLSPEAPFFQGRIVDCVMRVGMKDVTVKQVRELVRVLREVEKSGSAKKDEDKKALQDARDLAERTLRNLAVNWHNEAKKTRNEQTYFLASEVYQDYLEVFPDSQHAYDLRFYFAELLFDNLNKYERAAEEYTRVLQEDTKKIDAAKDPNNPKPEKPGRRLVEAAYAAVAAYDEVAKKFEKDEQLPKNDGKSKLPIPEPKKKLLLACERYIRYVPSGDKQVEVMYKAANILYRYNYLDQAVQLFAKIALEHPESELAEYSANLMLDSFNIREDWASMNEWARKFRAQQKLPKKFRDEVERVLEQSSLKLVDSRDKAGDFAGAAEAYLDFVKEFPKADTADQALFNASGDFFKAKMVDRSIEVRKHLVARYPSSRFLPMCVYANGESYETIGEFEQAAEAYETYAAGWEGNAGGAKKGGKAGAKGKGAARKEDKPADGFAFEESKAQAALFNAGIFRQGLGHYKEALRDRTHYLELWPDSKDAEAIFLSIAELHERFGNPTKALNQLDEYEKKYCGRDPDKMLSTEQRIAKIYEKQGGGKNVQRIQGRALDYYNKLNRSQKDKLGAASLEIVAKASFLEIEPAFAEYTRIKIVIPKFPLDEKKLVGAVEPKKKALAELQKKYTEVVSLKAADPAICSLYKLGLAFEDFSEKVTNAPLPEVPLPDQLKPVKHLWNVPWAKWPKEYKEQITEQQWQEIQGQVAEYKSGMEQQLRDVLGQLKIPLEDSAGDAFATAVQKSRELSIYNGCADKALQQLASHYKPDSYPKVSEILMEVKAGKAAREGAGLLTALQPLPPAPKANARKAAEDPGADLGRLGNDSGGRDAPADDLREAAPPRRDSPSNAEPKGPSEPEDPDLIK